ncbi:MAG: hypothetical protein QXT73_08665, partial [Candidatus Methanomethylicaceae archaeon]
IKGVKAVVVVSRDIIVGFDSAETTKDEITSIAKNCIEKLGYILVSIERTTMKGGCKDEE